MGILDIFKKRQTQMQGPPVVYPVPMGMSVPGPLPPSAPVDLVITMQQQGLTNNQIIQTLQRQGYQPQQIYDAMAQAESGGGIEPIPSAEQEGPEPFGSSPPQQPSKSFEETAEAIVEEKWNEFTRELGKINEWKDGTNSRLDKLDQSITDMKSDLDNLHKAIVSKISEYDKNLLDVGTEIKAMEKVFQKVLPELTGSVAELSRITKTAKSKPAAMPTKKR
jgi:DNA-binding transcriptional MerR regulator